MTKVKEKNRMSDFIHTIILDCEKASLLMVKQEDTKLSLKEKVQLWLHKKICNPCLEFENQNEVINESVKFHFREHPTEQKMPDSLKAKLEEVLKK